MKRQQINLDRLVRQILLDVALLHWFATTGRCRAEVLAAIVLQRRDGDQSVLDFLEFHCTPELTD
jgi:hypothetical protein